MSNDHAWTGQDGMHQAEHEEPPTAEPPRVKAGCENSRIILLQKSATDALFLLEKEKS
jgi:hypothetical protein